MSQATPNLALMPSLLDRLIDPESSGTALRQGYSVPQMVDAVRGDLEELLNARQSFHDLPPQYAETARSVLAYGLPDLTSMRVSGESDRAAIARVIEGVIARHEPRLRKVRVTVVPGAGDGEPRVSFHIDARLAVEPAPEVGFVTVLELATGQASVTPRAG